MASNASVGFGHDLTLAEARAWWEARLADPLVTLLVEREDGRVVGCVVGCVLLARAAAPNGRGRAEVAKLLVHSTFRRRGLGERLMRRVEDEARAAGLRLLFLDTETGSAGDRLYRRLGWIEVGTIPGFAYRPDGALRPSTFFYKEL